MAFKGLTEFEKPKEDWLRFENTHPRIIEQELWDITQQMRKGKKIHRYHGAYSRDTAYVY